MKGGCAMDKKYYEDKMREILEREDITQEERAQMVYEFTVLTIMQMLKNSK